MIRPIPETTSENYIHRLLQKITDDAADADHDVYWLKKIYFCQRYAHLCIKKIMKKQFIRVREAVYG